MQDQQHEVRAGLGGKIPVDLPVTKVAVIILYLNTMSWHCSFYMHVCLPPPPPPPRTSVHIARHVENRVDTLTHNNAMPQLNELASCSNPHNASTSHGFNNNMGVRMNNPHYLHASLLHHHTFSVCQLHNT